MKRQLVVASICLLLFVACDGGDDDLYESEQDYDVESQDAQVDVLATREPAPQIVIPESERVELTKWGLWTSDSPLLRGANIHQRQVYPELDGLEYMGPGPVGPPFTQVDFDDLAALGANYVNISHPGLFMEEPPYQVNSAAQANLDTLLAMIEQADMFAVISFRSGPGRSEFTFFDREPWFSESYRNDEVWNSPEAQDAWVEMWRYTAQRYKNDAIVAGYDLMVEPNADYVCCEIEDEPQEFYPEHAGAIYDWNVFYPRIVGGIRAVDPDTPILVGGMGLSGVVWLPYLEPTSDPYTVYTVHQYAPVQYTHQEAGLFGNLSIAYPDEFDIDYDGEEDTFGYQWLDEFLRIVDEFKADYGVPVAVNEFGPIRYQPGAAQFMHDQIAVFEIRGLNHALWEWGPAWRPLRDDQQEFSFRLGTEEDNYTDDVDSDLQAVIVDYWSRNQLRPSVVTFTNPE